MSITIDGYELTDAEAIRFHVGLESREGEFFPSLYSTLAEIRQLKHVPVGDASELPIARLVSRDALAGCAAMESEVIA